MSKLDQIQNAITAGFALQKEASDALAIQVSDLQGSANQILAILNEAPVSTIAGAQITLVEGANNMQQKKKLAKAGIDFAILDNGSATGTISFVDTVGVTAVVPAGSTVATSATSSDPGVTVTVDTTGLVLTIAPTQPLASPLPVGVIITAAIVVTNTDGTSESVTATSQAIDVDAGGPAGASISLA
jgi:hypothetical protein